MRRRQAILIAASLAAAGIVYLGFTQLNPNRTTTESSGESESSAGTQTPEATATSDPHEWQMLQQQLEKKPGHPPILLRMAQIALGRGEPSEAARLLRQAVEQEPENVDARLELGRALYESGDVAAAIAETAKILKSDPNHVDALYNLGAIYANTNQIESATDFWQRAVASDPNSDSGRKAEIGLKHLTGAITSGGAPPAALSAEENARLRDVLTNVAHQQ
jgi:cytochrome c-type biogenesis protein CcmH/NrfG